MRALRASIQKLQRTPQHLLVPVKNIAREGEMDPLLVKW